MRCGQREMPSFGGRLGLGVGARVPAYRGGPGASGVAPGTGPGRDGVPPLPAGLPRLHALAVSSPWRAATRTKYIPQN